MFHAAIIIVPGFQTRIFLYCVVVTEWHEALTGHGGTRYVFNWTIKIIMWRKVCFCCQMRLPPLVFFFSHWGLGNLFYENNEAKFEQRIPANTHTHTIDCKAEYRWKFVTKLIPVAMTINEAYFRVNIPIKVPFLPECILVSVRTGYTGPNSTHSLHWCTACIHRLWWNVGGLYCWRKPGYVPEVWGKHPVRLGDHSNYTCRYRWSNRRRRIESQCSPNWAKRQPLIYPCNEYFGRICDIMVEIYSATKTVNASNMISKAHNKMLSIEC